jgi:hypothetical protein
MLLRSLLDWVLLLFSMTWYVIDMLGRVLLQLPLGSTRGDGSMT